MSYTTKNSQINVTWDWGWCHTHTHDDSFVT